VCIGTGTFAWYGSADVTIYVTDPVYQAGISSACVPKVGYDIGVPLPYLFG
jgi:hypothetical protein